MLVLWAVVRALVDVSMLQGFRVGPEFRGTILGDLQLWRLCLEDLYSRPLLVVESLKCAAMLAIH